MAAKEMAVCHVIKNGSILLVKSPDGLSKGKWNAPNGDISGGEKHYKSAMRQVYQQTGLYVNKPVYHGTIRIFLNGKNDCNYRLQIFSSKSFSGDLKPNIKGEAKWFAASDIPYYEMWLDDKYWIGLVLQGKKFDADFFFDEKNEKIEKYQIRQKQEILAKAAPLIIVFLVLAVIIGVYSSGIIKTINLPSFSSNSPVTKNSVALSASNAITSSTTIVSTTILPTTTIVSSQPPPNMQQGNQTYMYYIVTSGNPPMTSTYYSIAEDSGITNWKQLSGNPINIENAECSVYSTYTLCTGNSALNGVTYNPSENNTTTINPYANEVANPECLALGLKNESTCYRSISS